MYSPSDIGWSVADEGVVDEVGGVSVDVESLLAERLSLKNDRASNKRGDQEKDNHR